MFMSLRYWPDPWKRLVNGDGVVVGFVDTDRDAWVAGKYVGRMRRDGGVYDRKGHRLDLSTVDIPLSEQIAGIFDVLIVAAVVFALVALMR
jgi:hypothetical protein